MTIPIHVLSSNFEEIGHRKIRKIQIFRRHFVPVWRRAPKVWACHVNRRLHVKFIPNRFRLPELFPKKWFRTTASSAY